METLDFWTPADALAFRCPPEAVGQLRPQTTVAPVVSGERPDVTEARLYAARAMRALARLAEGEGRTALEAARTILDRAYGPALAPLPPAAQQPSDPAPQPEEWPQWLEAQRLANAYRLDHSGGDHSGTND